MDIKNYINIKKKDSQKIIPLNIYLKSINNNNTSINDVYKNINIIIDLILQNKQTSVSTKKSYINGLKRSLKDNIILENINITTLFLAQKTVDQELKKIVIKKNSFVKHAASLKKTNNNNILEIEILKRLFKIE